MDVRLPDGRIITNVPEGTTKAQLMAKLNGNAQPEQQGGGIMENLQAFGKGATFGILPKAQALGIAAVDQIKNPQLPFSQSYDDAKQAAGQLTEGANPLSEIAGGLLSPANALLPGIKGATLAQKAISGAKSGAIAGATYGAGDLNNDILTGDPTAVLKDGLIGGAAGGLIPTVGAGLSMGGSKIANSRFGQAVANKVRPDIAPEALQTAQQFNIPLTVDQVAGGRVLPAVGKVSSQAAFTGAPLRNAYNATNDAIGGAIDNVAGSGVAGRLGTDKNAAGAVLQAGYKTGLKAEKNAFTAKYDAVYDMVPKDTPINLENTKQVASQLFLDLGDQQKATQAGLGRIWDKATAALQSGDITQARRVSGELQKIAAGNMGNETGNFATQLSQALRADIDGTVSSASQEAGQLLQKTNADYAQFKQLQEAASRIVGKKNGKTAEQVANSFLTKISQGTADHDAIVALKKFVPEQEWGQFADYAARQLGDVNGRFEAQAFARNVNKLGDKALEAVFNGGQAQDLRNLVKLVDQIKPQVVNPSGTAASGAELLTAGAGLLNPLALKGLAVNYALNRTLASPKLAKAYVRLVHNVKNGSNADQAVNSLVKMGEDANILSRFLSSAKTQSIARPLTVEVTPQDKAGGM